MKLFALALLLIVFIVKINSQDPDLPGASSQQGIAVFQPGSLIIPMDNEKQVLLI